eukprot:6202327-Pleurochrysis_carterae.AAC.3
MLPALWPRTLLGHVGSRLSPPNHGETAVRRRQPGQHLDRAVGEHATKQMRGRVERGAIHCFSRANLQRANPDGHALRVDTPGPRRAIARAHDDSLHRVRHRHARERGARGGMSPLVPRRRTLGQKRRARAHDPPAPQRRQLAKLPPRENIRIPFRFLAQPALALAFGLAASLEPQQLDGVVRVVGHVELDDSLPTQVFLALLHLVAPVAAATSPLGLVHPHLEAVRQHEALLRVGARSRLGQQRARRRPRRRARVDRRAQAPDVAVQRVLRLGRLGCDARVLHFAIVRRNPQQHDGDWRLVLHVQLNKRLASAVCTRRSDA